MNDLNMRLREWEDAQERAYSAHVDACLYAADNDDEEMTRLVREQMMDALEIIDGFDPMNDGYHARKAKGLANVHDDFDEWLCTRQGGVFSILHPAPRTHKEVIDNLRLEWINGLLEIDGWQKVAQTYRLNVE